MATPKLVRDKIPSIINTDGSSCTSHIADDIEYWQKLREKLNEEVVEFLEAENVEELADVLEVVEAICAYKQFDRKMVEEVRIKKKEERGGFEGRIILDA
jgi:predicted house-cleaning noncanonical NTP pyrophosphatase (MazG superfamily)